MRLPAVFSFGLLMACHTTAASDGGVDVGPDARSDGPTVEPPSTCNPLAGAHCLLPWPSSFFLDEDSSSATGFRVAYPVEAMPRNRDGKPVDPTRYNLLDGFSIGSQPVVTFAKGISSEGLPSIEAMERSLSEQSLVSLVDLERGDRVPLFAEVDANAPPGEAALIIRPQRPLRFDSDYAVVLREGLLDAAGNRLAPPEAFRSVRDGEAIASDVLRQEAERLRPVIERLSELGVQANTLLLAWDFHTASQAATTGPLIAMVDDALNRLDSNGPTYASLESTEQPKEEQSLLRAIRGEMVVPSYLESDDADALLQLDDDGVPRYRGEQRFKFYINIPRCAEQASGPLPVLVFGHGLLGDPETYLDSRLHRDLGQRLCMVEVATSWIGLSQADIGAIAGIVLPDLSNFPRITDRLYQAHVNTHALVELLRGPLLAEAAMQQGGQPITDGSEIYYLGISLGAIQGVTFAALQRRIKRFVFNVGAGWWAMMLERSSNFAIFSTLLRTTYRDPVDRALLLALSQTLWDGTDGISFAHLVQREPLEGREPKRIIMQESKDDDQVPNIATRAAVRALELPLLLPSVEAVLGIEQKEGPLDSAYVQWDVDPPIKPPPTNTTPTRPSDEESAHYMVRHLDSFNEQLRLFFQPDGQVVHTCGEGPCGDS